MTRPVQNATRGGQGPPHATGLSKDPAVLVMLLAWAGISVPFCFPPWAPYTLPLVLLGVYIGVLPLLMDALYSRGWIRWPDTASALGAVGGALVELGLWAAATYGLYGYWLVRTHASDPRGLQVLWLPGSIGLSRCCVALTVWYRRRRRGGA